ncbi:SDR family NAD(P)-dependent oxidoreductase [Paenibacillus sp. 1P07SE]|uniref:SDR family NAD(P)-dependent oxidoreductase n=1 Tax=Paenibacillus sp. 1P07SE TaxID=3132209 RepID=UPI0039A6C846
MSGLRLTGKTVVVTGAGSGIGRAIALRCGEEGAAVVVGDIAAAEGEQVAAMIRDCGGQAAFLQGDLREEAAAARLMHTAAERFGGPHVLVCNAGVTGTTNVLTATDEDWDRIMSINLKGAWYCAKHAIPYMAAAGGGSIVNISSTHAIRTQFNHFPYQAAKGGMQAMTLGICVDYGHQGIRANNLVPGFVMTPLARRFLDGYPDPAKKERRMLEAHPLGRLGTPEDIAAAAVFLASDEASFISGTSLIVDGGRSAYQQSD